MASRVVAVLISAGGFGPPGISAEAFRQAMAEDVAELISGLERVTVAAGAPAADAGWVEEIVWPGTPVIALPENDSPGAAEAALFGALAERGAETAAVIAADAPDLPGLLVGKLFRALGTAQVAACPAEGGGLVSLAARLPYPDWARGVGLDTPLALEFLREAAPHRRDLGTTPGWHRVRTPADLTRLDPGLEGWDATRALLTGHPLP